MKYILLFTFLINFCPAIAQGQLKCRLDSLQILYNHHRISKEDYSFQSLKIEKFEDIIELKSSIFYDSIFYYHSTGKINAADFKKYYLPPNKRGNNASEIDCKKRNEKLMQQLECEQSIEK
ncbi:MAG: hypothetical protein H7257_11760 [Taibaiella sp.]|nr:hypothetical protein [Taibaiella sp.]